MSERNGRNGHVDTLAAKYPLLAELRDREVAREAARVARVADFRRRFVDGPVLVLPKPASATFVSGGITPLGDAGVIYPTYRTAAEWGTLEAAAALVSPVKQTVTVPAPVDRTGTVLKGDGWTLTLAPGWTLRPGPRSGDFQLVRAGIVAIPVPDALASRYRNSSAARRWRKARPGSRRARQPSAWT